MIQVGKAWLDNWIDGMDIRQREREREREREMVLNDVVLCERERKSNGW